jgi:hypothetical protein
MEVGGQHYAPAALPQGKGGWVGPRAGLDGCRKSLSHWDSIPGPHSKQRVAILTELSSEGHI